MAENKTNDTSTKIVQSLALIALGVAFCFSLATQVLSIVLGIGLIVAGAVILTISIITHKVALTMEGILGTLLITLGIGVIVLNIIDFVVAIVPYLLITSGALIFIDAFLRFLWKKKIGVFVFVLMLILASCVVALGICFLTIADFSKYAGIALGITMIVYGVYLFILTMVGLKKKEK